MNTQLAAVAESAKLPAIYESARKTLAQCVRLDECKGWADKAAALASYARQAEDMTLENHAKRIQLRAWRRMGELLRAVEPAKNQHDKGAYRGAPTSRSKLAEDSGLSKDQKDTALRVARAPGFESLVEDENPPTVTAVAELGTKKKPADVRRSVETWGVLRSFSKMAEDSDPAQIAAGFMEHEIEPAIRQSEKIRQWLNELEKQLCIQAKT